MTKEREQNQAQSLFQALIDNLFSNKYYICYLFATSSVPKYIPLKKLSTELQKTEFNWNKTASLKVS